jgi:hypothetical protein
MFIVFASVNYICDMLINKVKLKHNCFILMIFFFINFLSFVTNDQKVSNPLFAEISNNKKKKTKTISVKLKGHLFNRYLKKDTKSCIFKDGTKKVFFGHRNTRSKSHRLTGLILNKIMFMYTKQLKTHMMVNYHNKYQGSSSAIKNMIEIPKK